MKKGKMVTKWVVLNLHHWARTSPPIDPGTRLGEAFLPVYDSKEDAEREYPGSRLIGIEVPVEPPEETSEKDSK